MKNLYRLCALVLALVLCLGVLSSCNGSNSNDPSGQNNSNNNSSNNGGNSGGNNSSNNNNANNPAISDPDGYSFVSSVKKLNTLSTYLSNFQYSGGNLYFTTEEYTEEPVYNDKGEIEEYNYTYRNSLWTVDPDGENATKLEGYTPFEMAQDDGPKWEYYNYIGGLVATENYIWIVENYSANRNSAPDYVERWTDEWYSYQEYTNGYLLRKLALDGSVLSETDLQKLTEAETDNFYVNRFMADGEGNLYIFSDMVIYVLDSEGEKKGKIETDGYLNSCFQLRDGRIVVSTYNYDEITMEGKESYFVIDTANMKIGEEIEMPDTAFNGYNFITGGGDYDLYYRSSTGFMGVKLAEGICEEVVNFIDADVDTSSVGNIVPLEDGSFLGYSQEWGENGSEVNLIRIYKVKNSEIPVKTVLTFACMYLNYNVRRQILEFNRNSDKYRIKVIDYSQYNTEEDYEAGLTKLTTELLAGSVPDMFDINSIPIDRLIAKGYIEDLTPYIEADTGIGGMAGLLPSMINAAKSSDGKLYYTITGAYLSTVVTPTSLVADLMRRNEDGSLYWTIQDLMQAYSRMRTGAEIFDQYTTKANILRQLMNYMMDEFIDWNTGECRFNSEDFIGLLKFTDYFRRDEYDWSKYEYDPTVDDSVKGRYQTGRQMLWQFTIYDLIEWRQYDKLMNGITFVGYPVASGSGNSWELVTNGTVAMSTRCSDKEGAWSFMRVFFTKEYQETGWGIPSNLELFNEKLEEACTPTMVDRYDENGNVIGQVEEPKSWYYYGDNGDMVYLEDAMYGEIQKISTVSGTPSLMAAGGSEIYPDENYIFALSDAQRDQILSVINSTDHITAYDETIIDIILEEAEPYFDGRSTAEQTAETIQRRLNLYVNEQR